MGGKPLGNAVLVKHGADLGDQPPLAAIKRIRIAFAVRAKDSDAKSSVYIASELSTSVELRN
jgi:hypothetical protein